MKQLEFLSSIDLLTGCKNRNAMNNAVDDIVSGIIKISEPYAVVFADLNGLKRINDEKGHGADTPYLIYKNFSIANIIFSRRALSDFSGD